MWCGEGGGGLNDLTRATCRPSLSLPLRWPGMTNAGKTYTVLGPDENPGLLPRALAAIFLRLDADRARASTAGGGRPPLSVNLSYLEVYNDNVYDLLAEAAAPQAGAHLAEQARPALPIKDGR